MTWQEILGLVSAIVTIIPTIVSTVLLVRNIIKNKDWATIMDIADASMRKVEDYSKKHPDMSSEEKLDMALESIKAGLEVVGIKLDKDLINRIIAYIKESIYWFNGMK